MGVFAAADATEGGAALSVSLGSGTFFGLYFAGVEDGAGTWPDAPTASSGTVGTAITPTTLMARLPSRIYPITGITGGGTLTVTPPTTGAFASAAHGLVVWSAADSIGTIIQDESTGDGTLVPGSPEITGLDTPDAEDSVLMITGSPTGDVVAVGSGGSVLRATSPVMDYGGRFYFLTDSRDGATSSIAASTAAGVGLFAIGVPINGVSGGGGGFQAAWARNSNIIL